MIVKSEENSSPGPFSLKKRRGVSPSLFKREGDLGGEFSYPD
jgi:hypothetical protein